MDLKDQQKKAPEQNLKARFFAQYISAEMYSEYKEYEAGFEIHRGVLYGKLVGVLIDEYYIEQSSGQYPSTDDDKPYLLLKPLSSINDEDAIEVVKILEYLVEHSEKVTIIAVRESLFEAFEKGTFNMPPQLIDFLRSRGYALPFMQYSVNQLIELGWIKLQHSK